jgi:hypothetical protein
LTLPNSGLSRNIEIYTQHPLALVRRIQNTAQDSKGIERYAAAASIGLAIVEFAFVETVPLENLDES